MKQILLITTSYPDPAMPGGREAAGGFVRDFAGTMAQHAQVTVVAPALHKGLHTDGNLTTRRFAVPRLPLSMLNLKNPGHWPAILQILLHGRQAVVQAARASRFEHMLALWALPSGAWARAAARQTGVPYSVWSLGSDIWQLGRVPIVKNVLGAVLAGARYRFADGYQLGAQVKALSGGGCGFLPSVRRLIPSRPKKWSATPPYRLAYLGRWHPNKGIDLLTESLGLLSSQDWERIDEVRICGGGPMEAAVASAVSDLQGQGRPVTMKGYHNKAAAAELLTWADYVLLPSRVESIPVIFSDAMQCQTPVIAMPVGDLPRLIARHNVGTCAAEVSAAALAVAIGNMLSMPPMQFQPHLESAKQAFNVETAVERFLDTVSNGV